MFVFGLKSLRKTFICVTVFLAVVFVARLINGGFAAIYGLAAEQLFENQIWIASQIWIAIKTTAMFVLLIVLGLLILVLSVAIKDENH